VSTSKAPATRFVAAALATVLLLSVAPASGVPIEIEYADPPGQGFFDPTLGAERRQALEYAVGMWAQMLAGEVPVTVAAGMESAGGTGTSALLASAGGVTIHRAVPRGVPDTWYAAALANQIAGRDINGPDVPEIFAVFNADLDDPVVLGSVGWYYGLDANPGPHFDFVTIALHEIGHGLGFFATLDAADGSLLGASPGIYERVAERPGMGSLGGMRSAERLAAIVSGQLLWRGAAAIEAFGTAPPVFAPDPFLSGSSLGHWDLEQLAAELMAPQYGGPNHDPGLLLPALIDMGWVAAVATATPRAPLATGTPTPSERPTPVPPPPALAEREMVYSADFDDGTVSVIDAAERRVVATIRVGGGPLALAVAPGGGRLYVANFRDGTVSAVSTRTNRVLETLSIGASAGGLAVSADGGTLVVTDTFSGSAVLVGTRPLEVLAAIPLGPQPGEVGFTPEGQAFITSWGSPAIEVVDVDLRLRRALVPMPEDRLLGIATTPHSPLGFVAAMSSGRVLLFDSATYSGSNFSAMSAPDGFELRALSYSEDGERVYATTYSTESGAGVLRWFDPRMPTSGPAILVGNTPEGVVVSPEDRFAYTANAGDDSVSVVDLAAGRRVATIGVGRAPMAIALAVVREVCDGDCDGSGGVEAGDLRAAVDLALEREVLSDCPIADADTDGRVTIEELVGAVLRRLTPCS
jgi:YVTN family beta-propeller protein